jgi:hypothetical protein
VILSGGCLRNNLSGFPAPLARVLRRHEPFTRLLWFEGMVRSQIYGSIQTIQESAARTKKRAVRAGSSTRYPCSWPRAPAYTTLSPTSTRETFPSEASFALGAGLPLLCAD